MLLRTYCRNLGPQSLDILPRLHPVRRLLSVLDESDSAVLGRFTYPFTDLAWTSECTRTYPPANSSYVSRLANRLLSNNEAPLGEANGVVQLRREICPTAALSYLTHLSVLLLLRTYHIRSTLLVLPCTEDAARLSLAGRATLASSSALSPGDLNLRTHGRGSARFYVGFGEDVRSTEYSDLSSMFWGRL